MNMAQKIKTRRRLWHGLSAATALLILTACTKDGDTIYMPNPDEPQPSTAPLVTVIHNVDALGDRSYNDLIYQGVEKTAHQYGLRTMQLSPTSYEEGLAYLQTIFQGVSTTQGDTTRQLFIICATGYDDYVRQNAHLFAENPYADLLYLETTEPLPEGCGSTLYLPYYGAMYEVATMVPITDRDALIVASNPEDLTVAGAVKGFNDGFLADYYDIDEEYIVGEGDEQETINYPKRIGTIYLAEHAGEGYNVPDTTLINRLFKEPIKEFDFTLEPILIPICGGTGSTLNYLMNILGAYHYVGVDVDVISPDCRFSCLKHIDRAVGLCIRQWLSPEGMPRHQVLGLASGYTGVAVHFHEDIYFEDYFNSIITAEVRQQIHEDAIRKEEEYEKSK